MLAQSCYHCGDPCEDRRFTTADKVFCCQGCLFVHDLLSENGLGQFYALSPHPGPRMRGTAAPGKWVCLDEPEVQRRLLDFTDGQLSRVTFHIPGIHCVACVWLLENLFRLNPAVGVSRVNFPRREVSIQFAAAKMKLSELAGLLCSLGYEPALTLDSIEDEKDVAGADGWKESSGGKRPPLPGPLLQRRRGDRTAQRQSPLGLRLARRRWLQIGVAGFAFGNIMLFSLPTYLGFDRQSGTALHGLFGWLSLGLALPVVVFSAGDFWRAAWLALRRKILTIEVPIVLGLAVIYGWSSYEVCCGLGSGYCDSLTGLVFFLLCGRAFQGKVREGLAFERDYKSFFPLAVTRKIGGQEESAPLSQISVGDRLIIRNGELIPADATLAEGRGLVDYSFVTGESAPMAKELGDHLYAGGKQIGAAIEVLTVKPVAQSYLASLWDQQAFRKERADTLDSLTNRYSPRFTLIIIAVAIVAAAFWFCTGNPARAIKAFASVLIVACPCALALASPFALGTGQRILARLGVFLKNPIVLERLARVDSIVFDKTGTLTCAENSEPILHGGHLSRSEEILVCSLARHSTHPYSRRIHEFLRGSEALLPVSGFQEMSGLGICGEIEGRRVVLGSKEWLEKWGVGRNVEALVGCVRVGIDGEVRGSFSFEHSLRPETSRLLGELSGSFEVALLSGDNERERARFGLLLGPRAELRFNQTPFDKLHFIQHLQEEGKAVMMVGDGLNDAGALKQSDVGVAVVGKAGAFSPASDIILEADQLGKLAGVMEMARRSVRIVRWSFAISAAYNLAGISIAAAGLLSPVVCAVLMPLSSVTVVAFACGAAGWAAKGVGLVGRDDRGLGGFSGFGVGAWERLSVRSAATQ
jgi:Cu+-exporting ATPase